MKVAFLANSYHLTQTRSSQFFIDLLRQWYSVEVISHQDVWAQVPFRNWDLIVAWQHQFTPAELEVFGCPNVVLVPMFDDCPQTQQHWERYRGFKVLCFSSTLARSLQDWGLETLTVRYQTPVPEDQASFEGGLRGFFWPRTPDLDWRHVGPLAESAPWSSFHVHAAASPNGAEAILPDSDALPGVPQQRTGWFERPEDYQAALLRANVFFAPRRLEGIGMATLEALALGQCVVAPDFPTANEYIEAGVDGVLFDPEAPGSIDWSRAAEWGSAARVKAVVARRTWEQSLPKVRAFLEQPPAEPRRAFHPWLGLRLVTWGWTRRLYRTLLGKDPR